MKIVKIKGGLGNQMFQYAFCLYLKKITNDTIKMDISFYNKNKVHNGFELYKLFPNLTIKVANEFEIDKICNFRIFKYHRIPVTLNQKYKIENFFFTEKYIKSLEKKDVYFEGYFQNINYLINIKEQLLLEFTFKKPEDYHLMKIVNDLQLSENSVGIHFRFGDYLKNENYINLATTNYYYDAINRVSDIIKNPHFYVFSDDINLAMKFISDSGFKFEFTYIRHENTFQNYYDMYLMSKCNILIIANSTFSWWSAFLNNSSLIFQPKHIFKKEIKAINLIYKKFIPL